jgi:hypothetical protein
MGRLIEELFQVVELQSLTMTRADKDRASAVDIDPF